MDVGSAAAELMGAHIIADKKVRAPQTALLRHTGKHDVAAHSAPRNVWTVAPRCICQLMLLDEYVFEALRANAKVHA